MVRFMAGFQPNFSPYPQEAVVVAIQPPDKVIIMLAGHGAGSRVPCRVLSQGPDDANRTEQNPLPSVGTHGLVIAVHGDSRNLMWLGSYHPALNSARHLAPGSGDVTYSAKQSGYWKMIDNTGSYTENFPDGTQLIVTPSGAPLTPNKQIVQNNLPSSQDIAPTPSGPPMVYKLKLSSGLTVTAEGNTLTVQGNLVVDGTITATQDITANYGTSDAVLLQAHTHLYTPGTGTPTQTAPPTAGT